MAKVAKAGFERFVNAVNGGLSGEDTSIWFYHQPPFYHIIPLLVTSQFEAGLHQEVRKGKYGSPEWIYFRSELFSRSVWCRGRITILRDLRALRGKGKTF